MFGETNHGRKMENTPNAPILFGWVSSRIGRRAGRRIFCSSHVIVAVWLLRKGKHEMQRHMDDIEQIVQDLTALEEKWAVPPRLLRVYVRP